ncbi:MAG TPA: glucose-6-phosphate dehydrogenase [Desulfobulbus sp.]|nr:glucose-6-phosphate dehydrogenase [Desulfobulbus sp.]
MKENTCGHQPDAPLQPCTIVIFGGSGDLTRRKLIPALFALFKQNRLPEPFSIVGCGRTDLDDISYRSQLGDHYRFTGTVLSAWNRFAEQLHYRKITYDQESFSQLADDLKTLDRNNRTMGNRLFDLAVPPRLYPIIADLLGKVGLAGEHENHNGWSRIVVEKPFGHDLDSALKLDRVLHTYFQEEQIYRIDHYLAKETVQNLLIFRFANTIFEPVWNRHYIDYVGITAAEQLGVENRAGYYDSAGVLRDMFQNHMMQLLVLTAMEPPSQLIPNAVHDEKVKVIRSLRDFDMRQGSRLCLGQYGPGAIDGRKVPGYLQEQGIARDSKTPSFAMMELFIDNWRWQDVPFFLVSGKRLPRKETRIVIQFKEVPHRLFQGMFGDSINANRLIIETFPEEAIRLNFQTKNPGPATCLRSMTMNFTFQEHFRNMPLDAYARVLLDCMNGDHMLFWRQDGIEASWKFLTPVLRECEQQCGCDQQLHIYPSGTWGPDIIQDTLQKILNN